MRTFKDNPVGLFVAVLIRFVLVIVLLGALFFTTAGGFDFINGWIYIITICVTLGAGFAIIFVKDKGLLEKRIAMAEKEKPQKIFVAVSGVLILSLYSLPGLDHRYGWSSMPLSLVVFGELLLLLGYTMNILVMLKNSYASRVIEIQEQQKVIDTGLYSVVRHPMYLSMILIYTGTSFILGSYIALIPSAMLFVALAFRLTNEEMVLKNGLEGYKEYMKKVKYRLIPFVW